MPNVVNPLLFSSESRLRFVQRRLLRDVCPRTTAVVPIKDCLLVAELVNSLFVSTCELRVTFSSLAIPVLYVRWYRYIDSYKV